MLDHYVGSSEGRMESTKHILFEKPMYIIMSRPTQKQIVLRLLICHEPFPMQKQIVLRLLFLSWACSETKFVMSILRTNVNHMLLVYVSYDVECISQNCV